MAGRQAFQKVMFEAADAAVRILLRHFGRVHSVVNKGEVDLVTVADKQAEAAIIRRIRKSIQPAGCLGGRMAIRWSQFLGRSSKTNGRLARGGRRAYIH